MSGNGGRDDRSVTDCLPCVHLPRLGIYAESSGTPPNGS